VAGGYLVVVGGGVALTVIARSRTLSVYNIEREQAEAAVEAALAEVGAPAARFGNTWSSDRPIIAIDSFDGLCHVNLKLLVLDDRLREELDRSLRLKLREAPPADNPFAGVLAMLSTGSMITMLLCVGLVAYYLYRVG
jgi:hypothetical protein